MTAVHLWPRISMYCDGVLKIAAEMIGREHQVTADTSANPPTVSTNRGRVGPDPESIL